MADTGFLSVFIGVNMPFGHFIQHRQQPRIIRAVTVGIEAQQAAVAVGRIHPITLTLQDFNNTPEHGLLSQTVEPLIHPVDVHGLFVGFQGFRLQTGILIGSGQAQ